MKSLSLQFLSFLQSQTDEWTHHMDKSIRSYGFENAGNLEFQEEADIDVFYSKVSKSKICLVGDFHTFSPCQRFFCQMMEKIKTQPSKIQVAVEFLREEDSFFVSQYMNDKIELSELATSIKLNKNWNFPLKGYLRILSTAKKLGIPIFGIRPPANKEIDFADQFFQERLENIAKNSPEFQTLVLVGEKHLGNNALAESMRASGLASQSSLLRVLLDQSFENNICSSVEKLPAYLFSAKNNIFCINRHPEWKKWLSVIAWEREFELNAVRHGSGISLEEIDTSEILDFLTHLASDFLRMRANTYQLESESRSIVPKALRLIPSQDDCITRQIRIAFEKAISKTPAQPTELLLKLEKDFMKSLEIHY